MILSEIYQAITTAPEILTPQFIKELLAQVLPLTESDADNDAVEDAINALYRQFKDIRNEIKALKRKSFDDDEPEITPGYETLTNHYPDIKKLELSLKKRIDKDQKTSNTDAKN